MTIKITREPDIHVTPGELARYNAEFQAFLAQVFLAYYAGSPITLKEYIRSRRQNNDRV